MPRKKQDKYVSDFMKIDDICTSGVNAIWSGVGSGKNAFIEGIHEEIIDENGRRKINIVGLADKYRVLLITSRKAKVTETEKRHAKDLSPYLTDIRYIDDANFDEYDSKSLICTTAHIKRRIERDYSPSIYGPKPFWSKFDFIVVDEFHSLISDATFSDTAFIMKCFIDKVYDDCIRGKKIEDIKTKMIFMSATPYSTENLISGFEYTKYDLLKKAKYVKPKSLDYTYYKEAVRSSQAVLKKGGTVVYYMSLLDKLDDLIKAAKEAGLDETQIAISVSDIVTIKEIKKAYPDTIYPNIEMMESYLSGNMSIPDNIKFFITNSKNKEGINISTIPELLVIEHHYMDDIIQICGRFRKGVKKVKVIYDRPQFRLPLLYQREEEYQREQVIVAANNYFSKLVEEYKVDLSFITAYRNKELKSFIDYIEKSTQFIRYNPFTSKFEMNECYIKARADYNAGIYDFDELMREYANGTGVTLSGDFFDGIYISYISCYEPIYVIQRYFSDSGWNFGDTVFTQKHEDKMLKELIKLRNAQPDTKVKSYKSLGAILKFFGCKKERFGRTEDGKFKVVFLDVSEQK